MLNVRCDTHIMYGCCCCCRCWLVLVSVRAFVIVIIFYFVLPIDLLCCALFFLSRSIYSFAVRCCVVSVSAHEWDVSYWFVCLLQCILFLQYFSHSPFDCKHKCCCAIVFFIHCRSCFCYSGPGLKMIGEQEKNRSVLQKYNVFFSSFILYPFGRFNDELLIFLLCVQCVDLLSFQVSGINIPLFLDVHRFRVNVLLCASFHVAICALSQKLI